MKPKRFIEQHELISGWQASGTFADGDGGEYPASYDTLEESVDELESFLDDIQMQIDMGERDDDEGFESSEFRIVDTLKGDIYEFTRGVMPPYKTTAIKVVEVDPVAFRLSVTGSGSHKYGNCEVCSKHVDSCYMLSKYRRFTRQDESDGLSYIIDIFGHKSCLSEKTN